MSFIIYTISIKTTACMRWTVLTLTDLCIRNTRYILKNLTHNSEYKTAKLFRKQNHQMMTNETIMMTAQKICEPLIHSDIIDSSIYINANVWH